MSDNGVIYILTNPSFPQYVKIGYASDLQRRLRELNRSEALPYAFRAYATYEVRHKLTDKALHDLLDQLNPDLRTIEKFDGKTRIREFFQMSAEEAYSILEAVARVSGTEDRLRRVQTTGAEIADETKAAKVRRETDMSGNRRSSFRFSMIGLKPGDEVVFKDNESIRAVVVDDTHIKYKDATMSLSKLAKDLSGVSYPLQGTIYFMYNGVLLDDMRRRIEVEKEGNE